MSIQEVKVTNIDPDSDFRGKDLALEAEKTLGIPGLKIRSADVYFLEGIDEVDAGFLAETLLAEPVTQKYELNPGFEASDRVSRIGLKPGVMNPQIASIMEIARDRGIPLEAADTAVEYVLEGETDKNIDLIARRLRFNNIINRTLKEVPPTLVVVADQDDLMDHHTGFIGAFGNYLEGLAQEHGFGSVAEAAAVRDHFEKLRRNPTMAEVRVISAWWSEHCKHKTFNSELEVAGVPEKPLFTRIRETAQKYFGDDVLSAFEDNSGVVKFYEGKATNIKGETHNSPSAIEPFGGAGTGVGGNLRDIFNSGQGAEVIFAGDILCFARWDTPAEDIPDGTLPPDYMQRGVIAGIADYGNKFGAPTVNGSVHYAPEFGPKPTVMVIAAGLLEESKAKKGQPQVGDLAVVIGGRTGKDGIGGATFSSHIMHEGTAVADSQAVQIGNPIEEKRMADAIKELAKKGLIRAANDLGAAGFSSAFGEMGKNIGITLDLAKAPLKYEGLAPWEIMISESQERSAIALDPANLDEFMETCRRFNVEATVMGQFEDTHKFNVRYGDTIAVDLDFEFLENGLPRQVLKANWVQPELSDGVPDSPTDWVDTFKKVLSHGNVCSKQPIVRRYDHGVQGGVVLPPFSGVEFDGPNDGVVITPMLDKPYGLVIGHGLNPGLNRIHPYWGTVWAATEGMANYVAAGGDPETAVFNENFVSPSPTEQYLGSLNHQVNAIVDFMDAFQRPVISGKDSLSSTYHNYQTDEVIDIPPVVAMTVMGRIPDVAKTTSADFKKPFSTICLVGDFSPEMGGSVYYDTKGVVGKEVPKVDLRTLPETFKSVHKAIKSGQALAVHDISEGGVLTAVAEMCFGGDRGVDLHFPSMSRPEDILFNETAGCFIVEVDSPEQAWELFGENCYLLGNTTIGKEMRVNINNQHLFTASVDELKAAWKAPLEEVFN